MFVLILLKGWDFGARLCLACGKSTLYGSTQLHTRGQCTSARVPKPVAGAPTPIEQRQGHVHAHRNYTLS